MAVEEVERVETVEARSKASKKEAGCRSSILLRIDAKFRAELLKVHGGKVSLQGASLGRDTRPELTIPFTHSAQRPR
jgi:hypothetical protein